MVTLEYVLESNKIYVTETQMVILEYVIVIKTGVSKVCKRVKLKTRILKLMSPISYLSSNIKESKI